MSAFLKYFLGLTFILYSFSLSAQLKSTVGKKSGDLGNNTFGNPILSGDYPDPGIMRDGKDYYMTHSAFDYLPALTVLHSTDLVNWEPVSYVFAYGEGKVRYSEFQFKRL